MELQNQLINNYSITPSNKDVIHINQHIKKIMKSKFNKQGAICLRGEKTNNNKTSFNLVKPSPKGLFQTIGSLVNVAHQMRRMLVFKPRWWHHIHIFIQDSIEESIINIQLSYWPLTQKSYSKNHTNDNWFNHETKCLSEVKTNKLIVTFSHKSCLIASHETINISFKFEKSICSQ